MCSLKCHSLVIIYLFLCVTVFLSTVVLHLIVTSELLVIELTSRQTVD